MFKAWVRREWWKENGFLEDAEFQQFLEPVGGFTLQFWPCWDEAVGKAPEQPWWDLGIFPTGLGTTSFV